MTDDGTPSRARADDAVDTDMPALARRVRRLEEIELARNHAYSYAAALDTPVPEEVAALFADDGVLNTRLGTCRGRDAIAEFYRDRLQVDGSEKRHFLVNPLATWIEPGVVRVRSHFLFTARAATSVIGWGTYDDLLRVDAGSAWFTDKTITLHVGTDLIAGWPAD